MDVATTTREQVRDRLTRGQPVREIALILGITTQAVYKHKKAIELETKPEEAVS